MSSYVCVRCKRVFHFGSHPDRCYDCNGDVFIQKGSQKTLERFE